MYVRSGRSWKEQPRLTASDGEIDDSFGFSVSVSGNILFAVSPTKTVGDQDVHGKAYVFVRSGRSWKERAKLTASNGTTFDRFGSSISVSKDSAFIGVPFKKVADHLEKGQAYVFDDLLRRHGHWLND